MTRLIAALRGRLESLPLPALFAVGVLVLVGTGVSGYYAYQTYDYVQHDNEFCFSCHLMAEPYELFAQSAHRGLGCKACHQPTLLERSQMGATDILLSPDSLTVHAEVPNELCADCHINGDPETWALIANSAGHRVHLESSDSTLQGFQCVECHSTGLHEFAAVDRTCAQSGCHVDADVQLGAMGDLTIHCVACHAFNAPIEADADLATALDPEQGTCLTCHEMRALVELPDPDPHEASCASCHNPHEQATPEEAVASCSSGDCHVDPVSLSPFHEGLEPDVAADCLYCHQAHDFAVDGDDCTACHQDIMSDDPGVERSALLMPPSLDGGAHAGLAALGEESAPRSAANATDSRVDGLGDTRSLARDARRGSLAPGDALLHSWGYPLPQVLDFRHSQHTSNDCADCHESVTQHGAVTVTTVTDCRSCHHDEARVEADGCAECHDGSGSTQDPYAVTQTMTFTTGGSASRALPFDHDVHVAEDCATCHTDGLELSAAAVDCQSCHEDHHDSTTDCSSCHVEAPESAHPIAQAHVGCGGAGCHTDPVSATVAPTETVCLVCHQDMVDHRRDADCAECHALTGLGSGR